MIYWIGKILVIILLHLLMRILHLATQVKVASIGFSMQGRSKKEVLKAQYTAAEAQVRIKENLTGISEEMSDVGVMNKAEDKIEQMKAKAQALDEMIDSGVLTDYTSNKDDIEGELEKMTVKSSVDQELAKLKAERDKRQKKITHPE